MNDLCLRPACELAALLRSRQLSARELLEASLARIDELDPVLNAVVVRDDERARQRAAELDEALVHGGPVGPLHGLPTAHKDLLDAAGLPTSYGSRIFAGNVARRDSLLAARVRAAGAVRLGKTNVPEFGAGSQTHNPVFGTTRNPYDPSRTPGGSSGGAAAALATGMVAVADGSDMGGSLRNPASFCNVVGLRPTPGRVPTWPAALGWSQLSVQGPMGRTVADVALQLCALAGPDPRVPISLEEPGSAFAPTLPTSLAGLRVAWAPDLGGRVTVDPAITAVLASSLGVFSDLGADVAEDCPDLSGADEVFGTLRAWLFESAFGEISRRSPDKVKESIRWNAELGAKLTGPDLARAEQLHTRLHERVVAFFERYDVLLAPTTQVLPFPVEVEYPTEIAGVHQENYLEWMRSCTVISATGCPALSVPGGFTQDGLPVGLQIVGAPRADRKVLEVGHAFEQATRFGERRPPL